MNQEGLEKVLEAALMAVNEPLSVTRLLTLFEKDPAAPSRDAIRAALNALQARYQERGIELKEVASGFRFQVRADCAAWINRLFDEKPQRYSRALMETLAIIAYRQPLTRGEIEDIRGVSVSATIIRTLQEREWVRVVGQRDVPGRPELLATTKEFLDYFNLKRLAELPSLAAIKDFDQLDSDLFAGVEAASPAGQAVAAGVAAVDFSAPDAAPLDQVPDAEDADAIDTTEDQSLEELDSAAKEEDAATDNVIPFSV